MSDIVPKIGSAIENFKARQQDITGLGHSAYRDLFLAANASMLTTVVQSMIQQSYAEMVTANSSRTSLLAAVSQQHGEIIAGCRVLTANDGILRALIDAANAATAEAFRMVYAERPNTSVPSVKEIPAKRRSAQNAATHDPSPANKTRRTAKKPAVQKTANE
jgi:uncharacterized protein YdbL (DUF1318 family)